MKTIFVVVVVFISAILGNVQARSRNRIKHQRNLDLIDPCHQRSCPKGRQCYVNTTSGEAECMCRPSCKKHINPVCGSDGIMYDNHCELHRSACLSGRHISIVHNVGCRQATVVPTVPPITPLLSTTVVNRNDEYLKEESSTEKIEDTFPTTENTTREETEDADDEYDHTIDEDGSEYNDLNNETDVFPVTMISPKNCTGGDFEAYKLEILSHYREQFRNPDGDNSPSSPPMTIKFLISFLFNHLDTDKNDILTVDELQNALTRDNIDEVSHACTLEDFFGADRNKDNKLVAPELYDVFDVQPVSIAEHNKVRSTTATAGINAVLSCDIESNYNLKISWERNGVLILENSHFEGLHVYHGDHALYIVNTNVIHVGRYTCYATAYPSVKQVHTLTVQVSPLVTMCPSNQLVQKGTTTKVRCYAEGIPKPRKSWFRNQNSLEAVRDKFQLDDSNSSLMVRHVDYADTGIFDCVATNDVDTVSASASIFIQDTTSTINFNQRNVYFFFHKNGIQVLEPDTCTFQLSLRADKNLPEDHGALCAMNKTSGQRECDWGSAINVKNRYIFASQPTLKRIIVIDLRLDQIVEVISTENMPVSLRYIPRTDSIWIEGWYNTLHRNGLHDIKVIRGASEPPPHLQIHLEPAGGHFDSIESLHIPTKQIEGRGDVNYGYIIHRQEVGLSKINLNTLTHAGRVDLSSQGCHPISVAFVSIGGYVVVNCEATADKPEKQLLVDYVTDKFIRFNDGVQGQVYVTPDGRYVISVDREEQHIQIQKVTDDGQIKTDFQVSTNLHISDLGFYPTMTSHTYDLFATSRNRDEAVFINLESGKVEMISGMHKPITVEDWMWNQHNRKISASGPFGPYMVSPSEDHVIILNGQYRRLHCDVDHLVHANVFAWVGVC